MQAEMVDNAHKESKQARFNRLSQRRLERAKEELRLLSQLSTRTYENTPEQAENLIDQLDRSLHMIAEAFSVDYTTRIGRHEQRKTGNAHSVVETLHKKSILDEVEVARVLDMLKHGNVDGASLVLRQAAFG